VCVYICTVYICIGCVCVYLYSIYICIGCCEGTGKWVKRGEAVTCGVALNPHGYSCIPPISSACHTIIQMIYKVAMIRLSSSSAGQVQTALFPSRPPRPSGCCPAWSRPPSPWAVPPTRPWCTPASCGWWAATPSTTPTTTWSSSKYHAIYTNTIRKRGLAQLASCYKDR